MTPSRSTATTAQRAKAPGDRFFDPIERLIYRLCGVDPNREQRWTGYGASLLAFSLVSVLALYALLRFQHLLPLNPTDAPAVAEPAGVQHRRQLRHQHQLAELRRRARR